MGLPSLDKLAFLGSLLLFAYLYGIATQAFGWFPSSIITQAWNQAEAVTAVSSSFLLGRKGEPTWTTKRIYDGSGVGTVEPTKVASGVTSIASYWEDFDWNPGVKLFDSSGRMLHEWQITPATIFSDSVNRRPEDVRFTRRHIHGVHLFPDGDLIANIEYVGTVRLNSCGETVWRLPTGSHHSIVKDQDGTFWLPGSSFRGPAVSHHYPDGFPGLEGPIYKDYVLHISEDGTVLQKITVLDLLYLNGLERHIIKATNNDDTDITHLNDVEPLPDSLADEYRLFDPGDVMLSLRNLDLLLVFDPKSSKVKWHTSHPTIQQHDPDFLGNGWVGVFDNNKDHSGGRMLGGSHIVKIKPNADSTISVAPSKSEESFYTPLMGEWQSLSNGDLLLVESFRGRVVEMSPNGSIVWEWIHDPYNRNRVPWVTGAQRYRIDPSIIDSWPCSSSGLKTSRNQGLAKESGGLLSFLH